MTVLDFVLPAELEAHDPPEARGLTRDGVRLLVGRKGTGEVGHHRFTDLPDLLKPGDVLVVNTSATMPAAVRIPGSDLSVHFSTELPDGQWLVELRRGLAQYSAARSGDVLALPGGATVTLTAPYSRGRLWHAQVTTHTQVTTHAQVTTRAGGTTDTEVAPDTRVPDYLHEHGQPIRYGYVPRPWPLASYQTVFGTEPGSAEMPSAARPFTHELVTRLVSAGVLIVPVLLHTGVASPEAHERPYPERFAVSEHTARVVNQATGRVLAVGTTAVRALESAARPDGTVAAKAGWTDLIITPERGVRVVDGLLTGLHEPRASHLDMLAAISGTALLDRAYTEAVAAGYLWHEFGDLNLLLP